MFLKTTKPNSKGISDSLGALFLTQNSFMLFCKLLVINIIVLETETHFNNVYLLIL